MSDEEDERDECLCRGEIFADGDVPLRSFHGSGGRSVCGWKRECAVGIDQLWTSCGLSHDRPSPPMPSSQISLLHLLPAIAFES